MSAYLAVAPATACFSVHAPADPQVLPRVLEVFAKRGMVPSQWFSTVCGDRDEELQIDIQVAGLDPTLGRLIAETLRQMYCVDVVLTSVKEAAA
jgi:acetolactate synthase regulatory subunit